MNDKLEYILNIVHAINGHDPRDPSRNRENIISRHVYFYLAKKFTKITYREIASKVGQDHAIVIHAIKAIRNAIDTNEMDVINLINECEKLLVKKIQTKENLYYSEDLINHVLIEMGVDIVEFKNLIEDDKIQEIYDNSYGVMRCTKRADVHVERHEEE